jgi:DNA polymerase-3 subunit delta'
MVWCGIQGHDRNVDQFRRALRHGRLASTFLFVGPAGTGKSLFARKLAQALLCEQHPGRDLEPCEHCEACQQVLARSHPDLEIVGKPKDRSFIPVDTFIGDREHRMREGLCHNLSLKPFRGGRKIAIIDDADFLNEEGANCLLKTLEEPPPRSVIILVGTSEQKQLPTIRSRCQIVRFRPLDEQTVAELLVSRGLVEDSQEAARLAAFSGGSVERALEAAEEALGDFRQSLLMEISRGDFDAVELVKTVIAFVETAGKDAPPRRERMLRLMAFAAEFYRQVMRTRSGLAIEGDQILQRAVEACRRDAAGTGAATAAACLERCLEAQGSVQANANQNTLLECWLDDLAAISRRGYL